MILRTATTKDVDEVFENLRDQDRSVMEAQGGLADARKTVESLLQVFPHQIFEADDGRVAALWIALRKWDGVIEIAGYTTNAVEENMIGFYKASSRGLMYVADILKAHKIECIVWGDYERSVLWLERLGFEKEGYMKQHGPNKEDATLMGRVF